MSQASQAQQAQPDVTSQSKPSYDNASNIESDDGGANPPSQEQVGKVEKVLERHPKDYRGILELANEYDTPNRSGRRPEKNISRLARRSIQTTIDPGMLTRPSSVCQSHCCPYSSVY